ncbi:hypothetical protein DEJ17_10975 [Curtobacterium sp. MCSS17_011]|uniref:hypothetical protein n=1 Tax=Curtobacterium sp. MCSS17_011 TaxID=2175643 RepID=UPI000D8355B6|nr:hypothetical protein [Curtobacterium sp. MCSS17_011]PYY56524.1 hypothetical protein DEJ17_10975 [Curtobacterium sp. MCSS17_011]
MESVRHAELIAELEASCAEEWGQRALLACLRKLRDGGPTEAASVVVHDLNPELRVRGLITRAPTDPNGSERTDAGEYLADYLLIAPLETVVYELKAYRDVIGEGLSVVEWTNPKARAEIQELAGEVVA